MLDGLVVFARRLRAAGLDASPARTLTFCRAVAALGPPTPDSLYWAGRLALVSGPGELAAYDRAFAGWLDPDAGVVPVPELDLYQPPVHREPDQAGAEPSADSLEPRARDDDSSELEGGGLPPGPMAIGLEDDRGSHAGGSLAMASAVEVLRRRDFESLSPTERHTVAGLIRELAVGLPTRRYRRLRPARRGRHPHTGRTLRWAVGTDGEPLRRAWRAQPAVERPLVLLLDVSGSMAAYARPLLQFAFAAHAAGRRVEVFCFATRLTRITPALGGRDPDAALAGAAAAVTDWDGGTRIAASLATLLRRHAQSSLLRGAVVVICSDGLERDDPARLGAQAARLARLAHRLVWVNPLKRHPGYEPLARGMATALPHVDLFLPGHNLAALEDLARAVAADG